MKTMPEPTPGSAADSAPDADPSVVARAIVLRKLTTAPRTRAQLADDLRRRRVPDAVAAEVLDRFAAVGLVDDTAYAEAWVRSRHAGRGVARQALKRELRARGVAADVVETAVAQVSAEQEWQSATRLVEKRLARMREEAPERRTGRLLGLLARRGYPPELAAAVVRAALRGDAEGCGPTS